MVWYDMISKVVRYEGIIHGLKRTLCNLIAARSMINQDVIHVLTVGLAH